LIVTYGGMKAVSPAHNSTLETLIFDPQGQIDEAIQRRISPFTRDDQFPSGFTLRSHFKA
jgi:hypothetical protein